MKRRTNGNAKRFLSVLLAVVMVLTSMPGSPLTIAAYAEEMNTAFTVINNNDTEGTYSYVNNVLTINNGADVTISMAEGVTQTTTDRIEVAKDANATITLAGVNIDVSATSGVAAFQVAADSKGNVTVKLAEGTENILKSGKNFAGLHKNGVTGSLIIEGPGSLAAYGGANGAGIGSGAGMTGSTVTINGGKIIAVGNDGAGIGAYGALGRGNVTINGGDVNATGDSDGAGIGGGSTGTVTITGGNITAAGGGSGSGIGGTSGSGEVIITGGTVTAKGPVGIGIRPDKDVSVDVTITGGTVTATGGYNNPGIKGHFSTGEEGKATVFASSTGSKYSGFSDTSNQSEWKGLIFNENDGLVGGSFTLASDFTIESGKTFGVMGDATLIIPEGVTLTNNGTLTIEGGNSVTGSGTITGDGNFFICPLTEEMIIVPNDLIYDFTDKTESIKNATRINTAGISEQTVCGQTFTPDYSVWKQDIKKVNDTLYTVSYTLGSVTVSKDVNVLKLRHLVVEGGTEGTDYTYEDTVVKVLTDTLLTIKDNPARPEGVASTDRVEVAEGVNANITLAGVNIDMSGTDKAAAFQIADDSAGNVTITLMGENTLKSGGDAAGLQKNQANAYNKVGTLTIGGTGSLTVMGGGIIAYSGGGAGIGSGNGMHTSGIIIESGTITAAGGGGGAGIGGGHWGDGTVTINGGTVKATGGTGAGIGGGYYGKGTVTINGGGVEATGGIYSAGIGGAGNGNSGEGMVTITGGTVKATGGDGGVGIGGSWQSRGIVTISGGNVTAIGSGDAAGIGDGSAYNDTYKGTFSTGDSGNAWIVASSISDQSKKDSWSGVIIEGNEGEVYGTPTLQVSTAIPEGMTLTVPSGAVLTVPTDVTLTNNGGTLTIVKGGSITGDGTITGSGTFQTEYLTEDMINVPMDLIYNGTDRGDYIGQNTQLAALTYCDQAFQVTGWTQSVTKVSDLEYTVTYTSARAEMIQKTVTLAQSGTEISANSDKTEYACGETITVVATPTLTGEAPATMAVASRLRSEPTSGQMALYLGDTQVSDAISAGENVQYTMTVSVADLIAAGANYGSVTLTAKFVGTDRMADASAAVTVTLMDSGHTVIAIVEAKEPTCVAEGTTAGEKCSVCGKVLTAQEVLPMKDHADDNNDGICDNGCGENMAAYGVVIKAVSATLEGDIGLNYYITLPQSMQADQGAYVLFTVKGIVTKKMVSEIIPDGEGRYKFTYRMNAKEMHDTVTFEVYDGSDKKIELYIEPDQKVEGSSFNYSLARYFKELSATDPALAELANATLAYGSYAQKLFDYDLNTVEADIDLSDVTADILDPHKMITEGEMPEGLTLSGMTLILETETSLCLYFDAVDMDQYEFTLDGAVVTPESMGGGLYRVRISNIAAKDLDARYELVVGDCTRTFSALSYAHAVLAANTNETLCDAVKALYKYNEAANGFFGS